MQIEAAPKPKSDFAKMRSQHYNMKAAMAKARLVPHFFFPFFSFPFLSSPIPEEVRKRRLLHTFLGWVGYDAHLLTSASWRSTLKRLLNAQEDEDEDEDSEEDF